MLEKCEKQHEDEMKVDASEYDMFRPGGSVIKHITIGPDV